MSISSEISRISGNVSDALTAIAAKGVTVPQGSNSDDLATLIGSIQTGGGTPSATAHTIEFELSDNTDATITAYWDDSAFSDTLRTTKPTTYNGKTIDSASLDGTEWYNRFSYTTVYEGTPAFYTDGTPYYLWIAELASVQIPTGSVWRVTINGTEYICTAQNSSAGVIIGNPKHIGGTDDGTDMPCAFYNYNSQGWSGDTITLAPGNYTVKIERQGS